MLSNAETLLSELSKFFWDKFLYFSEPWDANFEGFCLLQLHDGQFVALKDREIFNVLAILSLEIPILAISVFENRQKLKKMMIMVIQIWRKFKVQYLFLSVELCNNWYLEPYFEKRSFFTYFQKIKLIMLRTPSHAHIWKK